jgi:hypothetical protein
MFIPWRVYEIKLCSYHTGRIIPFYTFIQTFLPYSICSFQPNASLILKFLETTGDRYRIRKVRYPCPVSVPISGKLYYAYSVDSNPTSRCRIREYGTGSGTGSVLGLSLPCVSQANWPLIRFAAMVVDPALKLAAKFFYCLTCPGFGTAACTFRTPPALGATRQPSFCTPLLLSRPFTGLKALLLPLLLPPAQRKVM